MSDHGTGTTAQSRVGSRVGDYLLQAVIGVGGMGVVYSAVAPAGNPVALKLVKPEFAAEDTFRRRFSREARIAQTVRNPHVVPVLETGEHDGLPYFVAEFREGGSLAQRLLRESRLDVSTTVRVCAQVAEGLQALWSAGMVHRDVKPGNILFDGEGNACITDFGLAKDSQGTALTQPGQALGSLDYMSPEQIRGEEVTAATDVYALGCVIFECLHGQPPFNDRHGVQVLWAHLHDDPPDPDVPDDVPAAFTESMKVALRKEPSERPQSSTEYARTLSEAAGLPARHEGGSANVR